MNSDRVPGTCIDDLVSEITGAFNGVALEDGITLDEARAMDDWRPVQQFRAADHPDKKRAWQDIPEEELLSGDSPLAFLDAKGFRYYLPAFMLLGLKDFEDDKRDILDSCEYHLLHEWPKSLRQSEPAAISSKYDFTAEQCRAIAKFLRFVVGNDDEFATAERPRLEAVKKWEAFANLLA